MSVNPLCEQLQQTQAITPIAAMGLATGATGGLNHIDTGNGELMPLLLSSSRFQLQPLGLGCPGAHTVEVGSLHRS